MKTFLVNYNVYGTIEINAKDEEQARELAYSMSDEEKLEHLKDEVEFNSSFEVGTIEEMEQ